MEIDDKTGYLKTSLESLIGKFDAARKTNKRKAFRFRMAVIIGSALTTIVLGLHIDNLAVQPILKDCALVLSALVTALSAMDAYFNHRALWIKYTETAGQLKSVKAKLEYMMASGLDESLLPRVDELFSEFQGILSETNRHWSQLRRETEVKQEAQQQGGGYSPPAARPSKPTP